MEGPTTFAAPLMILKAKCLVGQLRWFPHLFWGSCWPAREEGAVGRGTPAPGAGAICVYEVYGDGAWGGIG